MAEAVMTNETAPSLNVARATAADDDLGAGQVLWVPSPVAIQVGMSLVPDPALLAAANEAWSSLDLLIDETAARSSHPWGNNLGALAVYGLWAELEIRQRGLITGTPSRDRIERIARRQFDIKTAAAGDAAGAHWLKPTWWGSDIHEQHRRDLERTYNPATLTPARGGS